MHTAMKVDVCLQEESSIIIQYYYLSFGFGPSRAQLHKAKMRIESLAELRESMPNPTWTPVCTVLDTNPSMHSLSK